MNAKVQLTEKATAALQAIADGAKTRNDAATALGVTVPVINGSLTMLKRHGLIEVHDDGRVLLTPDAKDYVKVRAVGARGPRGPRAGTKMEAARAIFEKFASDGRAVVIEKFRELGLTPAGSATYFQTLRTQAEAAGVAFQRGRAVPQAAQMVAKK